MPSIVLSVKGKYARASARSVAGFNIIEFIREAGEFLTDAGGHPMAAGFTVETKKILKLQKMLDRRLSDSVLIDFEFPKQLHLWPFLFDTLP